MYLGGVEDLPRWALSYGRIRATEGRLYRRSGGREREDSGENGAGSGQRRGNGGRVSDGVSTRSLLCPPGVGGSFPKSAGFLGESAGIAHACPSGRPANDLAIHVDPAVRGDFFAVGTSGSSPGLGFASTGAAASAS